MLTCMWDLQDGDDIILLVSLDHGISSGTASPPSLTPWLLNKHGFFFFLVHEE